MKQILTAAHQAFLAATFARNTALFGGYTMRAATEERSRLATLRNEATALQARLADGTATDEDVTRAGALAGEIRALVDEITAAEADDEGGDSQRAQAAAEARAALEGLPDAPAEGRSRPQNRPGDGGGESRVRPATVDALTRVGREFGDSGAYRDFIARGMSGTAAIDVADVRGSDLAQRATISGPSIPGDARNPYVPGVVDAPARALSILDMIDTQTTGLNSIPFVQETPLDPTTGALETAEGTLKPEVDVQLAEVDSPVRLIAAWLQVTRQAAEDKATMVGFIQGRLGFKVEHRINSQILNGNGTAPNLRGILNTSGIKTYAPGTAEARIISIRKGVTLVQQGEYQPDAVVMAPGDWEIVELDRDNNGQFRVSPSVQNALAPRIWGLNVIVNTVIAAGTACIGAFRLGATYWERSGVRVLITDSHASNFTSNILTILAESRGALTVWRPAVFCKITFNGTV